ncbi:DUF2118 domain-containing protein [Ignicoccus hospitalis]|uniref:DUF2118 domain-containing protein n=1 Tax=Ignicoccus hospitalis (strain KIN4/I / DSM 18386 / JCM 14125) TaxID=453591 RepID=A8ABP2_IGNH4|nr:DUF2118 domain-containing protein [Ignicoccus hospitalis]ABU82344.1 hypothetical protein Igni_1167 [Ignicoccus hospitalis KIN4/I]HIH89718.1 DUF2118 domain-containing protein [Desulfurococcaceae archaeon]
MDPYKFPRLFVEGKEGEEYAVVEGDEVVFVKEKVPGALGKVPYEIPLDEIVDKLKEEAKVTFLIHLPNEDKAILVPKGSKVKLFKVSHVKVGVTVKEGDELEEGDTYAYGLTGKGEVRRFRSIVKGKVVMVHWEPYGGRDDYHVLVVPEGAKELRTRAPRG